MAKRSRTSKDGNSLGRRRLGSRLSAPEALEDRRMMAADRPEHLDGGAAQVAMIAEQPVAYNVSVFDNTGSIVFMAGGASINLQYEAVTIGGGLTRYSVYLDDPTNALRSYFVGPLSFTGMIRQDGAGPMNLLRVNDNVNAANQDGNNYDPDLDTFFFQPFTQNSITPGITDTGDPEGLQQRTIQIYAGSGPGSQLDRVQIAQIVASGDITVAGLVSRNGVTLSIPDGGQRVMRAVTPTPGQVISESIVALGSHRLLGHALDQATQASFNSLIAGGATRSQLAQQLWLLPENLRNRVNGLYAGMLDRVPTQAELNARVAFLQGGGTEKQIIRELLISTEYNQSHATNAAFVDGLYSNLLGRPADPAGRTAWVNALTAGTYTRSQAVDAFLGSAEFNTRVANQLSQQLLLRTGGAVPGTGDARTIAEGILSSEEFARRALDLNLNAESRALTEAMANRIIGRAATLEELAGAIAVQGSVAPREGIAENIWFATDHLAKKVDGLYRAILRRPADPAGIAFHVATLASGQSVDVVLAALLTSAEYQNTYSSNGAYVDALYRDLLGRSADTAGRNGWIDALNSGTTRASIVQVFMMSAERRLQVIDSIYLGVLGRPADAGGRQILLSLWQQGATGDELARLMMASNEFFNKFVKL